jgi:hypothetical protein
VTYGIKGVTASLYPDTALLGVPGIERTTLDNHAGIGRTGCRSRRDNQASNDEDEKRREVRKHGGKQK